MLMSIIRSTIAGAVAGFVLKKVDGYLGAKQHDHKSQDQAEEDTFASEKRIVSSALKELPINATQTQKKWMARGVKVGLGLIVSAITRALRNKLTDGRGSVLGGALFGVASYVLVDKIVQPLLGVAESPFEDPLATHLRGLVSHAAFGITDTATRQMLGA